MNPQNIDRNELGCWHMGKRGLGPFWGKTILTEQTAQRISKEKECTTNLPFVVSRFLSNAAQTLQYDKDVRNKEYNITNRDLIKRFKNRMHLAKVQDKLI
jgi:hypothetical protein